jgi:hypothetical protein
MADEQGGHPVHWPTPRVTTAINTDRLTKAAENQAKSHLSLLSM